MKVDVTVLEKLSCPSTSLWWRALQDRVSQHNTRPARPIDQDRSVQDQDQDRSCPKTDGLRPHHWYVTACIHIGDVVDVMISLSEMNLLSEIACVNLGWGRHE